MDVQRRFKGLAQNAFNLNRNRAGPEVACHLYFISTSPKAGKDSILAIEYSRYSEFPGSFVFEAESNGSKKSFKINGEKTMVAISTTNNGVAMAALRRVNADLTTTQNRIATGYRVNSAKDDASVWATATQIRSDISASDSLKSGMSTAMAQADAASAALEEIGNLLSKVSDIVTAAKVAGDGNASQLAEVKVIGSTIKALIAGSAVNGVNLIDSASNSTTTKVTVSNGSAVGDMSFSGVDVALSTTKVGAILASTLAATDIDGLDVAGAQTEVANAATKIGAYSRGLDTMIGFTSKLADVRNNALGGLVDADLERETAKLQALQVRQQLAYQALSMSNNSAQNILMLFR